eukprot:CAMPEP_0194753460 /NCGR_PEP_ID=MMETSP0323_2-20130528/7390_1 /TAXON_ID=2866 ORGANISM="Crypthecodinium cohnii, Strain Seligo" /NCGR_SAMPLE_ID=MMETSP0323_2 /ASSEMBLY_ACC=CAM_ASM_000346 /LENGTH=335 /DNA_ID=CAMNT_0039671313 /DNA_START=49 /DNA_END=1056 /DNA_ORIENTATION=+
MAHLVGGDQQSAEELLTKLDTYREQLAQVEEALQDQPEEPSLLKLKHDLSEVVALTEDLVKYQAAAPAEEAGAGTPLAQPAPAAASSRAAPKPVHQALVGRTCEAFFEQKWYNAEIRSVKHERGIEKVTVAFIGLQNSREYKITDVKMLRPPHPAQCQPGTRCQAIFPEDGLWYDCVITEQTEKGYKLTFTDYTTKAEVKFDQVRLQGSASKVQTNKRAIKEVSTPAGYRIPESLVIQKTDTEEVIETKKRKIQAIKKMQRQDKLDDESSKTQSSWLKFHHSKASNRSKCGFLTGKAKESMFKVPDALDGRVGFMNSGQEMTKFSEAKKFTYQYV